ncbi:VC0807 family protein [Halobacillus rhizosphaerae]|uniref:VC0807 family protein n=1 Tax=Halobacillus rhizosphaerae TaxID=3064889 RepID=UPI00398AD907
MNNNKNFILLDLVCYIVFPLAVWHLTREAIGDYYAMLLSTVPGIIYTVYRFWALKKINVFGIYMVVNLIIGTLIDVFAGSALQLLWNHVIYAYVMAVVFLVTILLKKPLALYFGLDFTEMQGYDRKFSNQLFHKQKLYLIFCLITAAFALQNVILASIKVWLIKEYGVDAFDKGIILKQALSWGISFVIMGGYFYIGKVINSSPDLLQEVQLEMKDQNKREA